MTLAFVLSFGCKFIYFHKQTEEIPHRGNVDSRVYLNYQLQPTYFSNFFI
jgi:hypothetical protein